MISREFFDIMVIAWIGIAILIFPVLLQITAPYGRHTKSSWGPMISNRLGWFIMELPALALFSFFVLTGKNLSQIIILIASALWITHYVNRTLIFPLRIRTGKKKMPFSIVAMAFFFNIVNGFLNGYWLGHLSLPYPASWLYDPRFVAGVILFITGFIINQYHDHLLIRLRKSSATSYKMPHGGLFRYVSCPNFFGEVVEWGGFALLTWCLPTFSFFIWTFVNLIPRAIDHHRWYKITFTDYPPNRKAVIPFLV
jgi:3-oxo-5-alpha-steroid 4-dehydrogenase 1